MNCWSELFNTLVMALLVTSDKTIVVTGHGFGFARLKFWGRTGRA